MDPNAVVLDISSDEEVDWDCHEDRNWIAELLDEVNKDDCDDDSDEVVVVSEVLPAKNPRKKSKSKAKASPLIDLDDDCVILDNDPDKPVESRNYDPIEGHGDNDDDDDDDDDDDSDDLVVVGEKGQVACRDYPHPRHLCIKFPFSSTPNQSHCGQCYCYVCDSLAPCVFWGNGSASIDHCRATDKDEFWVLERKNSKNGSKGVQPVSKVADPSLPNRFLVPPLGQTHNQVLRPASIRACPVPTPNLVNQTRTPFSLPRSKYQPDLVSQQLIRTNNCMNPRDRGQQGYTYNLARRFHRPVFKRTGSPGVAPTANCGYRNPNRRHDFLVGSNKFLGSFPPQDYASSTVNPLQPEFSQQSKSDTPFDFSSDFHSQINTDPYVETPILVQHHPVSSSSQPQMVSFETLADSLSVPVSDYNHSSHRQENQGQSPAIHPSFTGCSPGWPAGDSTRQTASEISLLEGANPTDESSIATVSPDIADCQYRNWIFDNQPVEPGSMEVPVSYGLDELSPDPGFTDTGTIFNF